MMLLKYVWFRTLLRSATSNISLNRSSGSWLLIIRKSSKESIKFASGLIPQPRNIISTSKIKVIFFSSSIRLNKCSAMRAHGIRRSLFLMTSSSIQNPRFLKTNSSTGEWASKTSFWLWWTFSADKKAETQNLRLKNRKELSKLELWILVSKQPQESRGYLENLCSRN